MPYIGTSPSNGVRRVHTYTATASQTTFTGASNEGVTLSYADTNYIDVFQNGILLGSADYTSTSGTSVVLAQGASADDLIVIVVYDVFSVADTVSKTNGGTFDSGITIDADGATVLTVDRATSDGAIIDLQKGGTSVGKIGNAATDDFYIGASTASHSGLYFGTNIVYPMTANSLSDGATSLGHSSNRFNNLYLSGGVYLGGTGSANYIQDYEEGTWTPSFTNLSNTPTFHILTGKYTEIGRFVMINLSMQSNASPTFNNNNSTLQISGLPFAIDSVGYVSGVGAVACQSLSYNGSNNTANVTGELTAVATTSEHIQFMVSNSGGTRGDVRNVGATGGFIIELSLTYTGG